MNRQKQEENVSNAVSAISGLSCSIKKLADGGKMTQFHNACNINLRTRVSVPRKCIKMSVQLAHAIKALKKQRQVNS